MLRDCLIDEALVLEQLIEGAGADRGAQAVSGKEGRSGVR
jgi:hypothetical protein